MADETKDGSSSRKQDGDSDGGENRSCGRKRKCTWDTEESGFSEDEAFYTGEMIKIKVDNKIIHFCVKRSDTIRSIKLEIQAMENIPFDQQELTLDGMVLDDRYTLANLSIKNLFILTVTGKSAELMKIHVSTFTGKTLTFSVYSTCTIGHLKTLIGYKVDIPCNEQALIFNKTVLGDKGTLFDYYIKGNAILTLMRSSTGFMEIDIMILCTEETVTLKVKPSDTIRDVIAKLQSKTRTDDRLIFNGTVLHNDDTLVDCHINKGSTLTLIRSSTGFMRIFIRTLIGRGLTLDVKPSNTVRNVKSKIHVKLGIPQSYQRLTFYEKHMEDSDTLADYDIYDCDELSLSVVD